MYFCVYVYFLTTERRRIIIAILLVFERNRVSNNRLIASILFELFVTLYFYQLFLYIVDE